MSAAAFSKYAIARALKAGDSSRFGVNLKTDKDAEIAKAIQCARDGTGFANFQEFEVGGKSAVSYVEYPITLVLRSLAHNISYRTRLRMPNRDAIVRGVIQAAEDATPMMIYRRDLASFYENVPLEPVRDALLRTPLLSPLASNVLEAFFDTHCSGQASGVPRGLAVSAVLAELAMQPFDHAVRSHKSIYRYFRFSDDILIFSHDFEFEVDKFLNASLPSGLTLNGEKYANVKMCGQQSERRYKSFDYLGYAFHLAEEVEKRRPSKRDVAVSISSSKLTKLKSRIILSMKQYVKDGHASILVDRLRFLASNYGVARTGINVQTSRRRVNSGIYFNYKLCRKLPDNPDLPDYESDLKALDGFLQSLLFGPSSRFKAAVHSGMSAQQKSSLRALSFLKGYQIPMMVRFNAQKIGVIKAAWVYAKK